MANTRTSSNTALPLHQKLNDAETGVGFLTNDALVDGSDQKRVYHATPLTAGMGKSKPDGCWSYGFLQLVFNVLLHVWSLIITIYAATINLDGDDKLSHAHHGFDYIKMYCWVMIFCSIAAVALFVIFYGAYKEGFKYPIVPVIGGGLFFSAFVATLKLSYFAEVGNSLATFDKGENANHHLDSNADEWVSVALYSQCFVLASILFTGQSGIYAQFIAFTKQ